METLSHRYSDLNTLLDHLHTLFDAWTPTAFHAPRAQTDVLHRTRLALHEWVANLVQHAEFNNRPPEILLCLCLNEQRVQGVLEDNSRGFDLEACLAAQETSTEAYPERGMGLLILQACTENLAYQPSENGRFRLEFSIPANQDPCLSLLVEKDKNRAPGGSLDDPDMALTWPPARYHHMMRDLTLPGDLPTILLVEDDPAHADLVMRSFENHPLAERIVHLTDGEQALDYLFRRNAYADPEKSPCPHMVLLDLNLPRIDGLNVLAEIKSSETLRSIPVVILTTSRKEQDVDQAYKLHANSFMVKPFDFDRLAEAMQLLALYWLDWNYYPYS